MLYQDICLECNALDLHCRLSNNRPWLTLFLLLVLTQFVAFVVVFLNTFYATKTVVCNNFTQNEKTSSFSMENVGRKEEWKSKAKKNLFLQRLHSNWMQNQSYTISQGKKLNLIK